MIIQKRRLLDYVNLIVLFFLTTATSSAVAEDNSIKPLGKIVVISKASENGGHDIRMQVVCIDGYKFVLSWANTSPTVVQMLREPMNPTGGVPIKCSE